MHSRSYEVSLKELLYYGAWILFSIVYVLYQQSEFIYYKHATFIYKYTSYAVILLLCSCILVDLQFRIKELYIYGVLVILIGLVYLNRSNRTFFVYMLFILAFKAVKSDLKRLVRLDIKLKIALILFVLLMCSIGVIDDYSSVWGNGIIKHSYGFYHPNTLGILCFAILAEWLYLRYQKMKFYEWITIFLVAYLMYRIAASRTAAYTFFVIYLLYVFAKKWPEIFKAKIVKRTLVALLPVFITLSWLAMILYINGNAIAQVINSFTTQRLRYAAKFYLEYGISIFGKNVEFVSSRAAQLQGISSEILDMAYIRGPILFGIVFSIFIFLGYMVLLKNCLDIEIDENSNESLNIGLAIFVIYYVILGLGENYLLNPIYCVPMLLIPNAFVEFGKKNIKQ